MSFEGVIGQKLAVGLIKRAVEEKRFSHSYLFLGPNGVGKLLVAKLFAKTLNCLRGGIEPCGECLSCRKIEDKNHPDVQWLTRRIRDAKSDVSDGWLHPNSFEPRKKNPQIGIEMVRFMQKNLSLKPYEGKFKFCIIEGADYMTEEAANSLLKTLEETPKGAIIILLAANVFRLMPTIISRCQKIPFYPLDVSSVKNELTRRYCFEEDYAASIARFAQGSLGRAIETVEEKLFDIREKAIGEFIFDNQASHEGGIRYDESREKVNEALDMLALYLRDILIFNVSGDRGLLLNADKADRIALDSKDYTAEKIEEMLKAVCIAQDNINSNVNVKIALSWMKLNMI